MTTTLQKTPTRADLPVYLLLAFGGMWLAMSPLLLSGFHRDSSDPEMGTLQLVCIFAAMTTPALAAFVVLRYLLRVPSLRASLGLVLPRPWKKGLADCALALAVPLGLTLAALALGWLLGVYDFDLANLSGFRQEFGSTTVLAWTASLLVQLVIALPFFFGEELGWQGYLLPRLSFLGKAGALMSTALIFALWHLPTLLMGGQYPGHSWAASIGAFLIACQLIVPIFTWLRRRSNSVLPAVLAHAVVSNVTMRLAWLLSDAGTEMDPMQVGLQAWPGWVVMALFVGFLVKTKRL